MQESCPGWSHNTIPAQMHLSLAQRKCRNRALAAATTQKIAQMRHSWGSGNAGFVPCLQPVITELQGSCFGCSYCMIPAPLRHHWGNAKTAIVPWLRPQHDSCIIPSVAEMVNRSLAVATARFPRRCVTLGTTEIQEWCLGCSHNTIPAQMRHRWGCQNARIVTWLQPEHDSCADAASLAQRKCRNRDLAAATTNFFRADTSFLG